MTSLILTPKPSAASGSSLLTRIFSTVTDDQPRVIIPRSVFKAKWFAKLSPSDRGDVMAFLHIVFRCCVTHRTQKYRSKWRESQKSGWNRDTTLSPAPVSAERLKQLIDRNKHARLLALLIKHGVLKLVESPRRGHHAKIIGFTATAMRDFVVVPVESPSLWRKLSAPQIEMFIKEPSDSDRRAWFWMQQLRIDLVAALAEAETGNLTYVQQLRLLDCFLAFTTGDVYLFRDPFGNRMHSPLTNLHRDFRKYLRHNNRSLNEVDIRNSQPLCAANLVAELFADSDLPDDVLEFGELAASGAIYEAIAQHTPEVQRMLPEESAREAGKQAFIAYLFCDPQNEWKTKKIAVPVLIFMQQRFPNVARTLEAIKTPDFLECSKQLQRIEAECVIDTALAICTQHGFAASIHDSILTENPQIAENAILTGFARCKFKPQLRVVPLNTVSV